VVDVLALCAFEYQPDQDQFPGVCVLRAHLDDAEPSREEMRAALQTAAQVARSMRAGRTCLVTCWAGLNRSGLVSGLALRMQGYSGQQAVRAVQAARGPAALGNLHFRRIVENWRG
jgi:protein-tyrosine phosphatase